MSAKDAINIPSITESDEQLIGLQLSRVLESPQFKSAQKMSRFLRYIVEKTIAGKSEQLKQYTIAVEGLGLSDDFDSDTNPSVRILGGRVRERLEEYYQIKGRNDPIRIRILKGGYAPSFEKKSIENTIAESSVEESKGPKLGLFCLEDDNQSKKANLLLNQITSNLAKELSHYIFSRLYVQIPYKGKARSDVIGKEAKKNFDTDFALLLFIQDSTEDKYELVYRLWDNQTEEVISSEIFDLFLGQTESQQATILNSISATVADFYQGKIHLCWGRAQLRDPASIPESYQTLAYYRHYADNLGGKAFQEALSYCLKALERFPDDVIANIIFADYCRRDYVYSFNFIDAALVKGRESAETAIRLRPDSHEAHFVLGQILFCMGEWDRSINAFNYARKISKNHAVIEFGTGFHLCLMDKWSNGLPLVEKAMNLTTSYPSWYHLVPFLDYYRKGEYQKALDEALKIVTPNLLYVPIIRCAVYGQLGQIEKGKVELQALLNGKPDFLESCKDTLVRFLGSEGLALELWNGISKVSREL